MDASSATSAAAQAPCVGMHGSNHKQHSLHNVLQPVAKLAQQDWTIPKLLCVSPCVVPLLLCRAFLQLVSTVIMIAVGAPFALPALLVMMGVFYALYKYFMASVRQAKRLESVSRSVPCYLALSV
jgi:hypothetical protein